MKEYPGVQTGTLREKLEKVVPQLVHVGNGSEIAVASLFSHWSKPDFLAVLSCHGMISGYHNVKG